ncbi:protein MHF2 homolog isoform X2 [Hibiscus syriacus]|uniref:protein MHF2 homolog isoform X2 n=1 Tax=Hibiscus syriacus TaxID=106335 RepID=UPI0019214E85|nr:protein MHF2 homolog isoform X2 [Hibiscus syriacus]
MDDNGAPTFEQDLIRAIFKHIWVKKAQERERNEFPNTEAVDSEVGAGTSKKNRPTSEAVQRAGTIAEAEGSTKIEPTHLERILPQLLLDF